MVGCTAMMGHRMTYHIETLRQLQAVEVENAALRQELEQRKVEIESLRRSLSRLFVRSQLVIRRLSRQPTRTRRRLAV